MLTVIEFSVIRTPAVFMVPVVTAVFMVPVVTVVTVMPVCRGLGQGVNGDNPPLGNFDPLFQVQVSRYDNHFVVPGFGLFSQFRIGEVEFPADLASGDLDSGCLAADRHYLAVQRPADCDLDVRSWLGGQ
jgi:hypothetical protein